MTDILEVLRRADEATAWAKGLSDLSLIRDLAAAVRFSERMRTALRAENARMIEERDQLRAENARLKSERDHASRDSLERLSRLTELEQENARLQEKLQQLIARWAPGMD